MGRRGMGRRRFGPSLELNALALMAATAGTGLFGLVFWAVSARSYSAAEVGRASAVLSTASMFAVLASLNIGLVFTRILAAAGKRSRAIVLGGYGASVAVAGLLGAGFVLFIPNDALFESALDRLTFPVLAIVLAIFLLQDWVLIGLRAARWVPFEQFAFAIVKLGLVVLLAATTPNGGIVIAWALSATLAVLVISPLLLGRVLPNRPAPAKNAAEMPSRRGLGMIFLAEYATGAMIVIVPMVLPLIVVAELGTQANAYYALPWTISVTLTVLVWNITSSYMVEASNNMPQNAMLLRRTLRLTCLIGAVGVPVLLIAGPWLLSLLGGEYAAEGSTVLRLVAVAVPFTIVTNLYVSTSRVKQQMGRVVAIQLLTAATVIGLALFLVGRMGINGVGLAYLVAEVCASAVVIIPLIRIMQADRISLLREPEGVLELARLSPSLPHGNAERAP